MLILRVRRAVYPFFTPLGEYIQPRAKFPIKRQLPKDILGDQDLGGGDYFNVYVSFLKKIFKPQHLVFEDFPFFIKNLIFEHLFDMIIELNNYYPCMEYPEARIIHDTKSILDQNCVEKSC